MDNLAPVLMDLLAAKQLRLGGAPGPGLPGSGLPGEEELWSLDGISGCLVELMDGPAAASLTLAMGLVRDAQRLRDNAVWVTSLESCFFGPDAAEGGIDLSALTVVRVPRDGLLKAADKLARSGAFGLIVIDMTPVPGAAKGAEGSRGRIRKWSGDGLVPQGAQARLLGLAGTHDIGIVFLTGKRRGPSRLGSLVSLRGEARRTRLCQGRFQVEVRAVKDKRRAPGWCHARECFGPAGLR